ncbi:MAG: sigma factor-like helix-turn-helix DNA-binding protein [Actinomycetota bacterium]
MKSRQRAALVLRFWSDVSDEEIADTLGCTRGTVRSLVSRGLAALRIQMDGEV